MAAHQRSPRAFCCACRRSRPTGRWRITKRWRWRAGSTAACPWSGSRSPHRAPAPSNGSSGCRGPNSTGCAPVPSLDPVEAERSADWRGTLVHEILEYWHREGGLDAASLVPRACRYLDEANVHPLIKALWRPRLVAALNWFAEETLALAGEGRRMIDAESR